MGSQAAINRFLLAMGVCHTVTSQSENGTRLSMIDDDVEGSPFGTPSTSPVKPPRPSVFFGTQEEVQPAPTARIDQIMILLS